VFARSANAAGLTRSSRRSINCRQVHETTRQTAGSELVDVSAQPYARGRAMEFEPTYCARLAMAEPVCRTTDWVHSPGMLDLGETHLPRVLRGLPSTIMERGTHRSLDRDAPVHRPIQRNRHSAVTSPFRRTSPSVRPDLVFGTHTDLERGETVLAGISRTLKGIKRSATESAWKGALSRRAAGEWARWGFPGRTIFAGS
jgi:hypothetical protein